MKIGSVIRALIDAKVNFFIVTARVGVNSFLSIPIRRKMQLRQFQFNSIHLKKINVQFQFNSIHELFNSNSIPIPYHRYFI